MPKKNCLAFLCLSSFAFMFGGLSVQAEPIGIYHDGSTQTNVSGDTQCLADCTISGRSRAGGNLFHSFREFNIPSGVTVTFEDNGATNIFTRVSQKASHINGTLAVIGEGRANFFLLNPHGVVFGSDASLDTAGSFVASTADSIQFLDGVSFVATDSIPPLLTISTPLGLHFDSIPGAISHRSQAGLISSPNTLAMPVGLQVDSGETLALISNGIFLEGGGLTAFDGQVVLGSVTADSSVYLTPNLDFKFEDTQLFRDIHLNGGAIINTSGQEGLISISGRNLLIEERSVVANLTRGILATGKIDIFAEESIKMVGGAIIFSPSLGSTSSGANLEISTKRISISRGAVLLGGTTGLGRGGRLQVNASESIEVVGTSGGFPSLLTTSTEGAGAGGDIELNTRRLSVLDGAQIQAVTYGSGKGGDVKVNASDSVEINGTAETIIRGKVSSGIFASSGVEGFPFQPTGNGGNLMINTDRLLINDNASVAVSSFGSGNSGDLTINARSVRLDNGAQLTAAAEFSDGGNLWLNSSDTLLLRRGGSISTRAGAGDGQGNGGNIAVNAGFVIANLFEDSDIVAKAAEGRGGNISVNASGVYGISPGMALPGNGTNDIDASSDFGISGTTRINRLVASDDIGLVNLSEHPLRTAATVNDRCGANGNSFVVTARSGIPDSPSDPVDVQSALVDLGGGTKTVATMQTGSLRSLPLQTAQVWIEADSWSTDERGQVVLEAAQPRLAGALAIASCTRS